MKIAKQHTNVFRILIWPSSYAFLYVFLDIRLINGFEKLSVMDSIWNDLMIVLPGWSKFVVEKERANCHDCLLFYY